LAATVPDAPAEASALVAVAGAGAAASSFLTAASSFFSSSFVAWIYLCMAGALTVALWCFWFSTLAAILEA
jgi:hypothetical protein